MPSNSHSPIENFTRHGERGEFYFHPWLYVIDVVKMIYKYNNVAHTTYMFMKVERKYIICIINTGQGATTKRPGRFLQRKDRFSRKSHFHACAEQDSRRRCHTDLCLVSGGSFGRMRIVLCNYMWWDILWIICEFSAWYLILACMYVWLICMVFCRINCVVWYIRIFDGMFMRYLSVYQPYYQ